MGIVLPLLILVQITSFADVGALAGGAVAAADPAQRGAALALYALAGFTTGFLGPIAVGTALDWFGGPACSLIFSPGTVKKAEGHIYTRTAKVEVSLIPQREEDVSEHALNLRWPN
jgi:hypothetical protein